MPDRLASLEQLTQDPLLALLLLACALLFASAVLSGIAHRGPEALGQMPALSALLACVAVSLGIHLARLSWDLSFVPQRLQGALEGFPLILVALAYGPIIGFAAGVAYLLLSAQPFFVTDPFDELGAQGLFLFQLLLTGWLAIYPSPRLWRWAGPFGVGAGYLLAAVTLGLLLAYLGAGELTFLELLGSAQLHLPELLIWVFLASLIPPVVYARLFPMIEAEETGDPAEADGRQQVP